MKKIIYFLATTLFLTPAAATAFEDDLLFPTDSRIKMLPYDPSDIYTIPTKYGYQTSVVFDPHEEVHTISMGDRSLWQIIPSGNRLFIRPMIDDVITNMTVITSKRSYYFDLKSLPADGEYTNIVYVAKFVYPEDTPEQMLDTPSPYDTQLTDVLTPETKPKTVMPNPVPPKPVEKKYAHPHAKDPQPFKLTGKENHRYTYAGPDELAPLQVFDNGKSTFFKFRDISQPLPNAYLINKEGDEIPVAHYVKGGLMIIDDVTAEWLLKSSAGDIMIYNEMMTRK